MVACCTAGSVRMDQSCINCIHREEFACFNPVAVSQLQTFIIIAFRCGVFPGSSWARSAPSRRRFKFGNHSHLSSRGTAVSSSVSSAVVKLSRTGSVTSMYTFGPESDSREDVLPASVVDIALTSTAVVVFSKDGRAHVYSV